MDTQVMAVVVTRDRPKELRKVTEALLAQTMPPDRIVVVDNEGGIPAAATLSDLPAEIIRCPANAGGAGGFRIGMERALMSGADWIWLLDDDAVPEATALASLLGVLARCDPETGALCGSVAEYGSLALQHRRYFDRTLGVELPVPERCYGERWVSIDTASFVGLLVSARVVRAVGLPNADFFLGYDDTEFSLRLRAAGLRILLVPDSRVLHLRPAGSRMRESPFGPKHYYNVRNRIVVKKRYCRLPLVAALGAVILGVAIWAYSRAPLAHGSFGLLCRAIADGWRGRLGPLSV